MPQYTEHFSEVHQPLNYTIYQVLSPGIHYTPYVAINDFHRVFGHWFVGNMGPASYVYVLPMEAQTAAGAGAQWLPWHVTFADQLLGDEIGHHGIELQTAEFTQGYQFVAFEIGVYVNPIEFTMWTWGVCPRYPAVPTTFWDELVWI